MSDSKPSSDSEATEISDKASEDETDSVPGKILLRKRYSASEANRPADENDKERSGHDKKILKIHISLEQTRKPGKKRKQARPSRRLATSITNDENVKADKETSTRKQTRGGWDMRKDSGVRYVNTSSSDEDSEDESKKKKRKKKHLRKKKSLVKKDGQAQKPSLKRIHPKVCCEVCGKIMSRNYLAEHVIRIHSSQTFHCNVCGRKVRSPRSLENHMKMKHSENAPHKCTICGTGLSSGKALNHHMIRSHGPPNDKPFKCNICEKRFLLKYDLQSHATCHSDERAFVCDACGRGFRSKGNLKAHYRIHTGEKPFKCRYCEQTFSFRNSLKGHERRHTGENPYLCSACGKGFPVKHALTKHLVVHSDERPFKCTQCEKSFRSRSAFDMHKDFHLGVKRWECSICKRRFLCQGNMIKHRRRHLADRRHVCEICSKGFVEKQELRTHMKTHTGEKRLPIKKRKQNSAEKQTYFCQDKVQEQRTFNSEEAAEFPMLPDQAAVMPMHLSECDKANTYRVPPFYERHQTVDDGQYRLMSTSDADGINLAGHQYQSSILPSSDLAMDHCSQENNVPVDTVLVVPNESYQPNLNSNNNQYPQSHPSLNPYNQFHPANFQNHLPPYLPHEKLKNPSPILRCTLCKKDFTSHTYIKKHLVEYHRVTDYENLFTFVTS